MLIFDARDKILMVNSEIEKQFGYARGELIGQPVEILVPEALPAATCPTPRSSC